MPNAILVPLDGSKLAEAVLPYAEAIARLTNARIRLFSAVDLGLDEPWLRSHELHRSALRLHQDAQQRYLESVATAVKERGGEAEVRTSNEDVVDSILKAAGDSDVTTIALTTHGRGGAARLIFGSVADKVLRLATKPTLLVRGEESETPRTRVALQRLLLPLDGSQASETAITPAAELAQAAGATLVLVRAEHALKESIPVFGATPNLGDLDTEVTNRLQQYLAEVKQRLPAGIKVETEVYRGYPSALIPNVAIEERIDLVVMATHGRGTFRRLVMGSMADRMVRVGAPTLLIRVREDAA